MFDRIGWSLQTQRAMHSPCASDQVPSHDCDCLSSSYRQWPYDSSLQRRCPLSLWLHLGGNSASMQNRIETHRPSAPKGLVESHLVKELHRADEATGRAGVSWQHRMVDAGKFTELNAAQVPYTDWPARSRGTVLFRDSLPVEVSKIVHQQVIGKVYRGQLPNGDFTCQIDNVRNRLYRVDRSLPPGLGAAMQESRASLSSGGLP